eukprot:352834-Chlamydomonas_euryale.AAC.17
MSSPLPFTLTLTHTHVESAPRYSADSDGSATALLCNDAVVRWFAEVCNICRCGTVAVRRAGSSVEVRVQRGRGD